MVQRTIVAVVGFLLIFATARVVVQGQDVPYRVSDKELERLLGQMKKDTDRFRKSVESAINKSHIRHEGRADDIKDFIKDFDKETDKLHDRFKDHKSVSGDVQSVLDRAAAIDRFMVSHDLRDRAQRDWATVRADLDQLAQAYNVSWDWRR
jgi:hypothetical protein